MTDPAPVPARFHQDGWTPDVQAVFLENLMVSGSVREAAWVCGKTTASAYKRRAHVNGAAFKAEWMAAIAICVERVRETAIDRAFNGRLEPTYKDGVETGERRVFNDRLLIQLMRLYDAPAYHAERALAAQAALSPPWLPKTRDEEIAAIEAVFETVRVAAAAREAEMAALLLEDAAEAARGDDDLGVSKESPKAGDDDDFSVSKESPKAGDADDFGGSNESLSDPSPPRRRGPIDVDGLTAMGPRLRGGDDFRPSFGEAMSSVSNESPKAWSAPAQTSVAQLRVSLMYDGAYRAIAPAVPGSGQNGPRLRSG